MTHIIEAKYICIGSPTLNNNIMPTVSAFCTYLKGLAPKNRKYIAFGSYGWSGQSIGIISDILDSCGYEKVIENIRINYLPTDADLENVKNKIAEKILI